MNPNPLKWLSNRFNQNSEKVPSKARSRNLVARTLLAVILLANAVAMPTGAVNASPVLTIEPITWNTVGLDSNNVNVGPNQFPVGARVCNTGTSTAENVSSIFEWDSSNSLINLTPGTLSEYSGTYSVDLAAGECKDFYYEISVTRNSSAYDTSRQYHITATADGLASISTPDNREIFVEHLVSQSRNSVENIEVGTSPANLQTVPVGGSVNMTIGNTYYIRLNASTAPGGYNQLESYINLNYLYFRVNSVVSTYTIQDSNVSNDTLYSDSCGWENDITSPDYRSCVVDDGKSGGSMTFLYSVTIMAGAGSSNLLSANVYDFSGSSYHYNADYSTSFITINLVNGAEFSKTFSPATIFSGDTSTLTFAIENSQNSTLTDLNFVDVLPAGISVADIPNITYGANCADQTGLLSVISIEGQPDQLVLDGLNLDGNETCTISIDVTSVAEGTHTNTTANLFQGTEDLQLNASANLTVLPESASGGSGCVPTDLVRYRFETGGSLTNPVPTFFSLPSQPTTSLGAGLKPYSSDPAIDHTVSPSGTVSWGYQGTNSGFSQKGALDLTQQTYFEFVLDTSDQEALSISFYLAAYKQGPTVWTLYAYPEGESVNDNVALATGTVTPTTGAVTWTNGSFTFDLTKVTPDVNLSGNTVFRLYLSGADADNAGVGDAFLDDVIFQGCSTIDPTMSKAFSPSTIEAGTTSTLTFTIDNPNSFDLSNVSFSDSLPSGMTVASVPNSSTTCGGSFVDATAGSAQFSFSGGTILAEGTCSVSIDVTTSEGGSYNNQSSVLSSTQTGAIPGSEASAVLTVISAPTISKNFSPDPIYENGLSTLTFTLSNPNPIDLSGAAFTDTFPAGITVAADPAAVNNCGGDFSTVAGAGNVSLVNGNIPANDECTLSVSVTGLIGDYTNQTGEVQTNEAPDSDSATDTLSIIGHYPGISLLKHVSKSISGPWSSYITVDPANSDVVYYRFVVENIGDVDLSDVELTDPALDLSTCSLSTPFTLTTADPIRSCILGPIAPTIGYHVNTASVIGTYDELSYTDTSSASYNAFTAGPDASASLTKQVSLSPTGPWDTTLSGVVPGTTVYYRLTVTNTGGQPITLTDLDDPNLGITDLSACGLVTELAPGRSTSCVIQDSTTSEGITTNIATVKFVDPEVPDTEISVESNSSVYPAGTTSISGTVWADLIQDFVIGVGESGIPSVLLSLYIDGNNDGDFSDPEDILVDDQYTDGMGGYIFNNLPTGINYKIVVTDPIGYSYLGNSQNNADITGTIVLLALSADSSENNFAYEPDDLPDLVIQKSNSVNGQATVGIPFTWSLVVTNNGNATATFSDGVQVISDNLPSGPTYGTPQISDVSGVVGWESMDCTITLDVLGCVMNTGELTVSPGGTFTVSFSSTINSLGNYSNQAMVDPNNNVTESRETNNNSNTDVLAVLENADEPTPTPTDTETPVPTETFTPTPTDTETPVPTETFTPTPTDTETPVPTETFTPTPTDTETPVPTETVTPTPTDTETPLPTETFTPTATPVLPIVGLAKQIVGEPLEVGPGTYRVTYEIIVQNSGPIDLTGIQVSDDLVDTFTDPETYPIPTGFSVVDVSSLELTVNWPVVGGVGFNGDSDTNLLTGVDTLLVGENANIILVVDVIPSNPGPFLNSAFVSSNDGQGRDTSNTGSVPDPDQDLDPTNNSEPTVLEFEGGLFDPPSGKKSFDSQGNGIILWEMVWVNDQNQVAVDAAVYDPIPEGAVFYNNGIQNPYPLPAGAPVGSTNYGVACESDFSLTSTTACYYEGPTAEHPRGQIVWMGTLGPDYNVKFSEAQNEIRIEFSTRIKTGVDKIENIATIDYDADGNGLMVGGGEISVAKAGSTWMKNAKELPETGFRLNAVTPLLEIPLEKVYSATDILLEIPRLRISIPVVGVPLTNDGWDVSWLFNQAGYLSGTAFPTWNGNSVLTAHVVDANGLPGPFYSLSTLQWGDQIILHAFGERHIYEVRENYTVSPSDLSPLGHAEESWVTLITCKQFDETSGSYLDRVAVQAVLVGIEVDK
ncbi:MAG TPA: sortase [Anaerolineales bacterium]|nr:sortase [Anaerolineales bacterium]